MRSSIIEKTTAIVAKHLKIDPKKVVLDSGLSELGADSLDHIEIVLDIEDAWPGRVYIDDEQAEAAKTVAALVAIVETQLKEASVG